MSHSNTAPTAATAQPTGTPLGTTESPRLVINERYTVTGTIGRGSMGEVYRVRDAVLDRDCALKRFTSAHGRPAVEARLAASLAHPSIVPVHDFGTLADGGDPWMVMQLVDGTDLNALLATRRLERRRLLEYLLQVAQAIAYAHARGVVHRDLKPDNVRISDHGAVFVLDWGIAERVGVPGVRLGSPRYMAPEQAAGAISQPTMDVFALGRLLARILDAHPPDDRDAESLRGLVTRCTAIAPDERLPNAQAVVDALLAWFDGAERRREAEQLIHDADKALNKAQTARHAARAHRQRADDLLAGLRSYDPAAKKYPGWIEEDAADAADARALQLEVKAEQLLNEALRKVDELPAAMQRLAELARAQLHHAHRTGDRNRVAVLRHRLPLLGATMNPQTVRLHTDPPAQVFAATYQMQHRRLVAIDERRAGTTPLEIALPPGSHRLRLVAPDRPPAVLPVHIDWADPVDWIAPDERRPYVIPLPAALRSWERYVPAGWCRVGGDDAVSECLPGRRIWVDGFIIEAEPLTCSALVAGLNAMLDAGETALAEIVGRMPRDEEVKGFVRLIRRADGRFACVAKDDIDVSDWPATHLDWHAARAWAEWRRRITGEPWRLPDEIEWEKAARGADGRRLPWGDHFEPTWACVVGSRPGKPQRGPTRDWPDDVSVYGVRGMAGNIRSWCRNPWTREGDCPTDRLRIGPLQPEAPLRILKGGFYLASTRLSRPAARYASHPSTIWASAGVRLVRSITG